MAWRGRKGRAGAGDPWSVVEQPVSKKRKVEEPKPKASEKEGKPAEETKDDWDDSIEFTQDELETLDVVASQAINQSQAQNPASTSEQTSETSFVVPTHTVRGSMNRSSSSSSSDSSHHPPSFSSRSSVNTSGSLSSHSSSNGKLDPTRDMLQTLQSKLDEEVKRAQEEKYRSNGEIKYLRESLRKQEEELEKLRARRDESFDQQKQMQTEKLHKLQSQLDSLNSQAQFKDKEFQDLREQNLTLQQKLKRLEQLQQQPSTSRSDTHLSPSPRQASPRKVPVQPSPPSKQQQLQKQREEVSGQQQQSFPTQISFMEKPSSANVGAGKSTVATVSSQTTGVLNVARTTDKPTHHRRLHLNVGAARGPLHGSQIVRHLLQASASCYEPKETSEKTKWDPGLAGLLHAKSTSLQIAGLTYSRSKESSYLSPVKPRRHRQLLRSPGDQQGGETVQVVSRENFQLAIEGLSMLLESTIEPKAQKDLSYDEKDPHVSFITSLAGMKASVEGQTNPHLPFSSPAVHTTQSEGKSPGRNGNSHKQSSVEASTSKACDQINGRGQLPTKFKDTSDQRQNYGTLMLLPLLTDYIHHYVDLIHSSSASQTGIHSPASLDSTRSLADSSSYDSSIDSLSSHIAQLLNEGKIYASSVEGHAVSALRCLALLIRLCPLVGQKIIDSHISNTVPHVVIVSTTSTSSSSTVETLPEPPLKRKISSGADADDERSTSSSEVRIIGGTHDQSMFSYNDQQTYNRGHSTLLHLIMRLADQDLEDTQSNSEVVKLALVVLTCLCRCCPENQMSKLDSLLTRGILTNCFKQTRHSSILLWGQRLLASLAECDQFLVRLCLKSENCPLYLMHRICSLQAQGMNDFYKEYITSLSSIISSHKSELSPLLCNPCPCSSEIVVAVIMAMYKLFNLYKTLRTQHKRQPLLSMLAKGVMLIYTLAQTDPLFAQHHAAVQLQYVTLLSGLVSIMRPNRQEWDLHLSALEELCDFEPDISDLSQESEGDDRMDQS